MIERIQDSKCRYLVYDMETQNLNTAMDNLPWQLGFLICEGNKILEEHCAYIKWPKMVLSEGAAKVTRFDIKHYEANAVENEKILDHFESYLYNPDYLILGQNVLCFDTLVHNIWRKALGRKTDYSFIDRVVDSHCIAKGIKLEMPYRKSENWLGWQYSMSSVIKKGLKTSLTTLGKENKIDWDYENLHSAASDINLNWVVWNKYCKPKLENWLLLT